MVYIMNPIVENQARKQVGDGKLPNRYFVSVSNDYYYYNKETDCSEWAGERDPDFKSEGGTIRVFNTYAAACKFVATIGDYSENIEVKTITIEDRLSGQIFERSLHETEVTRIEYDVEYHEDLGFTKEEMKKRGEYFE